MYRAICVIASQTAGHVVVPAGPLPLARQPGLSRLRADCCGNTPGLRPFRVRHARVPLALPVLFLGLPLEFGSSAHSATGSGLCASFAVPALAEPVAHLGALILPRAWRDRRAPPSSVSVTRRAVSV